LAQAEFELVMQEDPAPAELVPWQHTASGEVEDGG
jgi:hypothetical protein